MDSPPDLESDDSASLQQTQLPQSRRRRSTTGTKGKGLGRSRPRASLACLHCRQRKVKCNTAMGQDTCGSCQSLQIPCLLSRDGDRRKTGSREQVSTLQDRVQYLEALVSGQRPALSDHFTIAGMAPDFPKLQRRMTDGSAPEYTNTSPISVPRIESASRPSPNRLEQTSDASNGRQFNTDFPPMDIHPTTNVADAQHHDIGAVFGDSMLANDVSGSAPDTRTSDLGRMTPPSEKGTSRLEVDEDKGQARFYGPTSQAYHSKTLNIDSDLSSGLERSSVELSIDSKTVRALLFQTYWKSQPLSTTVVDQHRFETARRSVTRTEYYSTFLENCLLACATRMSTSADIRALGARYVEQAQADLAQELQNPNIATLQGFLLLSDFESTRGKDRLGYMYCGIGCRLVFDLGLQEDCSELVAQGKLSASEASFRHFLFLSAFVFETLWSYYLGRPRSIPNSMVRSAQKRSAAQACVTSPPQDAWVGMCLKMSDVTEILNGDGPLDTDSMECLNDLDETILALHRALPSELAMQEDQLAELSVNAYGLHIQLLGLRAVLHRLLIKAHTKNTTTMHRGFSVQKSQTTMHENAILIARLCSAYQQIFGIENVITIMLDNIFLAAALLTSHVLRLQREDPSVPVDQDVRWLRTLADILEKAQKHYPVTARMRSTLSTFVETTSLAGLFGVWAPTTAVPTPAMSAPSTFQSSDIFGFGDGSGLGDGSLSSQDMRLFDDHFLNSSDRLARDMDLQNMLGWVLSPPEP